MLGCEDELSTIVETKKVRPIIGRERNRKYEVNKGP